VEGEKMPTPIQTNQPTQKRAWVGQTEFPNNNIQQAQRIAHAIWDDFAGKGAAPHQVAMAIDMSPTSGTWRNLCGSSIAYGLTEGGYNASQIVLTELGRRLVAPIEEGDDARAKVEAILQPRVLKEFFQRYDKAKFPKDEIAKNVLVNLGLPKDRADKGLQIVKEAGEFAGVILQTKSGPFVALDNPSPGRGGAGLAFETDEEEQAEAAIDAANVNTSIPPLALSVTTKGGNRVFITHGKNKKILEQVKQIVQFGKFDPVVAQEHETVSKPVPQKVLDEMRTCNAAVIHVGVEAYLLDEQGNKVPQLNGNVLIEIGAAMALYKNNFVLLVEDGVTLPSNLQGLYECRYSGDELGMEATMKLLKAFNDFN
jgi:predicted nucleotide-binding protein